MKNQTSLKGTNSIQHQCLKSNPKTEKKKETPWKRKFVYFAWEKDLLIDGRPALLSENTVAFRQSSNFPFDSGCRPVTLKANFSSWSGQKGNAKRVREERRRVRDASKSVLTMEGPGHEYEGVTEGSWNSRWKGWTRKRITKWTSRRPAVPGDARPGIREGNGVGWASGVGRAKSLASCPDIQGPSFVTSLLNLSKASN